MGKYNLTNDMITNIRKGFVKIENKYVIPVSGPISIIKDIFTLVFRSQTDKQVVITSIPDMDFGQGELS